MRYVHFSRIYPYTDYKHSLLVIAVLARILDINRYLAKKYYGHVRTFVIQCASSFLLQNAFIIYLLEAILYFGTK